MKNPLFFFEKLPTHEVNKKYRFTLYFFFYKLFKYTLNEKIIKSRHGNRHDINLTLVSSI